MSIPAEPSLFQNEVQILMPSCASSSLDLVATMSCGLTLQICLIIALSSAADIEGFGFVNGQVSLAWSIALSTQELYTCLERWQEERIGSSSLNFFKVVFTHAVVGSSKPPAAVLRPYLLGSKRSNLDFPL